MRVITGMARGRKLKAPKGMTTRPTSDRVKEALFNVLGSRIVDSKFLDLFAGSGGVGIEALSRGAKLVTFVEENPKVIDVINDNLIVTGLKSRATIYRSNAYRAMEKLQGQECFDIIFLDPPYLKGHETECLQQIERCKLLSPEGLVVVESSKRDELPQTVGTLTLQKSQHYGDTKLTYYTPDSGQAEVLHNEGGPR